MLLEGMGVEFVLNCEIGRDITLDQLLADYDAVFTGTGAYRYVKGGLPGEDLPGVYEALPYLVANARRELGLLVDGEELRLHGRQARGRARRRRHRHGLQSHRDPPGRGQRHLRLPSRREEHARLAARGEEQPRGRRRVPVQSPADRDRRHERGRGREGGAHAPGREGPRRPAPSRAGPRHRGSAGGRRRGHRLRLPARSARLADRRRRRDLAGRPAARRRAGRYPFQTTHPKIFAGGDNVRGSDLVVTAVFEGREAAKGILAYLGV
jgi:glutamate synthase (NADPH) small chain